MYPLAQAGLERLGGQRVQRALECPQGQGRLEGPGGPEDQQCLVCLLGQEYRVGPAGQEHQEALGDQGRLVAPVDPDSLAALEGRMPKGRQVVDNMNCRTFVFAICV